MLMKKTLCSLLIMGLGVLSAAQAAQAKRSVYILTGQSNSLGAVKGTPAGAELLERYASNARLWNGNMERDTGRCFDASPSWQPVAPQLPKYGNLCMGPEYGFAHMMQRRGWHSGSAESLFIIKASLDGGGNSCWLPEAAAWKSLSSTVQAALAELKGGYRVQGLLYLQGESDKEDEITRAPERFLDLHSRLRKEVKKGLSFAVAGECATWGLREEKDAKGNTTAALMEHMAAKERNVGWVRTRDLTKITKGDNMAVHYDGKSQLTIGARYAYAVALLEKLPFTPTRGDAPKAALNTPAAWWGGKLPTAADVVRWDVSSANAADTLGADMTVAGVEVEDPFRGVVSIAASAQKPAALHIGAKGVQLANGDLQLHCAVVLKGPQLWQLASGCKLCIGSEREPVSLSFQGEPATVQVSGPQDAEVELHLASIPRCVWRLSHPAPRVKITCKGKPIELKEGKNGSYTLSPGS